ncbi:MAG: ATPase domain-containing protein [Methanobacteriota archaeon]
MKKIATGVSGFDKISNGGFNNGSVNLVSGGSGTGKTIFTVGFLLNGAKSGEPGLFITFEESRQNILDNIPEAMRKDLDALSEKAWFFDLSVIRRMSTIPDERGGAHSVLDADVVIEIIESWVRDKGIKRVVLDGIASLGIRYGCDNDYRGALFRLTSAMKTLGLTSIITTEVNEEGKLSRNGVEEFVADSIVLLSNRAGRRTLDIRKMRGSSYSAGEHGFGISNAGLAVYPMMPPPEGSKSKQERVNTGLPGLDEMLGGGALAGDSILVTGSAGTGKTIFGLQFVDEGAKKGEKCLVVSFEEPPEQLRRNAMNVGIDIAGHEAKRLVKIIYTHPRNIEASRHMNEIVASLDGVSRVLIDSITDYEPAMSEGMLRALLSTLTSEFRSRGITTILTSEAPELIGAGKITNTGTSFIVDAVVMLRFVEIGSEMKKALNVLKVRGSKHVREIREYSISERGITIGKKFEGVVGLMSGTPRKAIADEVEGFFEK